VLSIRPFDATDVDYEGFARVENGVWPDYPVTVEELRHSDKSRDPKYLFRRFVVEVGGEIVATFMYCEPWWAMKPGKYHINLEVLPEFRRRGIGTACYNQLMVCLTEHGPEVFSTSTRDDQKDAIRFLKKRGFQQVMRFPTSELDVSAFDFARFSEYPARMEDIGIEIRTLEELGARGPDWIRKWYELENELMQDVPAADPFTPPTFDNFQERRLGHPAFNAASQFVALDGDVWVGISGLWVPPAEPDRLYTGLTGVVRSHRRKGIATAMKLRGIAFAEDYGAKSIETDNEENNPMYELNLKLGFEPRPAWLQFEKCMKSA
jgi:mycothiol synthase